MWTILFIIIAISVIWGAIENYKEKKKSEKLAFIAREILGGFNFEKEKQEILAINNQFAPEEYRCPKCKGILLLRNGIYGKFFGCSRYPICRFTKKM